MNQIDRKQYTNRLLEIYLWIIIAFIVVFPAWYYSFRRSISYDDFFLEFYNQLLLGALLILIPILFKLIFGKLPLEYIRMRRELIQHVRNDIHGSNIQVPQQPSDEKIEKYQLLCINESKAIAERIFTRSGVYLLVGCLIAFIGVAIFYSPIFEETSSDDVAQRLLDYLPRFGALFFIEFIALFFLRQYRIMLEEYRYYEAIKRNRQDNLNLIDLMETNKDNPEFCQLIVQNMSTTMQKLSNGETTEILETQKILNQEIDVFSKVVELVKEIKKK